jgi:nucleoside phosphorylase
MPEEVTIGVVTAIPIELAAVRLALDLANDHLVQPDPNHYCIGDVPSADPHTPHRVVVTQQPRDGTRDAAAIVVDLTRSFSSVRAVLMCGIAAGTPLAGIQRGDIVSATAGIVDYGHLRAVDGERLLRRTSETVSAVFLRADHRLAEGEIHERRPWTATLAALGANPAFRRPQPGEPAVHRGAVGSGDVLLRDAGLRDSLAAQHRVIAFEMEASGVSVAAGLHGREWFMVRGISDLADAAKDDRWHGYAAAAAAAYLRALLAMAKPFSRPSPPAPPGRTGGPGSAAAVARIVDAMLGVRRVREEHERQRLVDALPGHIRAAVAYSPTARTHVISIIRTCEDYPDGRDALLDALALLLSAEGPEYARLEQIVRDNWRRT